MITETRRLLNSWECYTPDIVFLNCESCALEFAKDNNIELDTGLHTYGTGATEDIGISECYACGHCTDYPLSCDGCGEYLAGDLTPDGVQYLKERNFPKWLRDYYLSTN
jgi:hypothetical protein